MSRSKLISILVLVLSLLIVVAGSVYMSHLASRMAEEEQHRINIWAEATEQLILADENTDIDFYTSIIEANTSIPVYMLDADGNILLTRNVKHPSDNPTSLHGPITVHISDEIVQYIYYDDSNLLFQLRYFPYVQFSFLFIFILVAIITLYTLQRSEQDKVWVGLSKETAHQLGTPISSLNAWQELLENTYPDDALIPQMRQDIERLHVVAERFSKVGSVPELRLENLAETTDRSVRYMRTRFGARVQVDFEREDWEAEVLLSAPLFSWVLENLMKNAVDAGATEIVLTLTDEGELYQLDVADNGKGIPGRRPNRVFEPGYTTKQRGWGLGLSLSKRIVEDYHRGQLLLHRTEPGRGTTFRILLKKPKDC